MAKLERVLQEHDPDIYDLLIKIGMMWLEGTKIDWYEFYSKYSTPKRSRIPLPTYPFAGQRYWIDTGPMEIGSGMLFKYPGLGEKSSAGLYQRPELSTEYVAPGDEIERALTGIWQGLFGIKAIGIHDDFYELGGDSLKAITAATEILQKIKARVPIVEIFQLRTVEKLGKYINSARREEISAIAEGEKKEYYSLSSAQRRLYVLHQLDTGSTGYNNSLLFVLKGNLDVQRLENAFKQLVSRHESLRTSFETLDEVPVQRINREAEFEIEHFGVHETHEKHERGGQESATRNPQPATALISSFIRPFDLSAVPLLRVGLIRKSEEEYVLMVDMHHIITDGTSVSILVREFVAFYAGQGEKLPGLRIQYKDYAQWQDNEQQKEAVKKQEEYWMNKFSGEIPVLNLPVDYARPTIQSFAGSRKNFSIGEQETRILKDLASKEDATLFMVLLSLYNIMLAKICSQEDIVVGTPVACRRHTDLQHIMGMLVNTLTLRNYPSARQTFMEFLRQVRDNTMAAFENQDYLFEDLVERVTVQRDVSRNPIFDTMFAMQNFGTRYGENLQFEINGLSINFYEFENNISIFDLSLTVLELENGLTFIFEYCTKLFQPETIDRFTGFFENIVSFIVESPGQRISHIPMMSEAEKSQVLYDFNDTETQYPRDKTIHALFQEQVEKNPDNIATAGPLEIKYRTYMTYITYISYRELNQKSNQLASLLIEKGVGPDTIVGIIMERSVEMVIGILGILKAGGAYLPFDPDYPEERIKYMLEDSSAKVLITTSTLAEEVQKFRSLEVKKNFEIIFIDSIEFSVFSSSHLLNFSTSQSSTLAYIIYTSGTTGKPKGVMTTHTNVIRVVRNTNYIEINKTDRVRQLSNYAFDGSVFDIYGALLNGAVLLTMTDEEVKSSDRLSRLIKQQQVMVFFVTTALFNTLVDLEIDCLSGVRKVLFGGERVSVEHSRKALTFLGKQRIIHVYGPTETTVYATYYFIDEIPETTVTIPIGPPISNTIVYIFDKYRNLVPIGVSGEIFIGGAGTARGYLNQPELTAGKFCLRRPGYTKNCT